jgi:hypothetical protein
VLITATGRLAAHVVIYYRKRWICEESIQFLKSMLGPERFHVRRYEAIKRLMILAMLVMGFLTCILLENRQLTNYLLSFTTRFRRERRFAYYRLLDGPQELSRLCVLCLGRQLLQTIKNG